MESIKEEDVGKQDIYETFLEFEKSYELFSIEPENIPIWEFLRYDIYSEVQQSLGEVHEAHSISSYENIMNFRWIWSWLKNSVAYNPYLSDKHDYMFVGHPRRKSQADGYQWDLYCDPILVESDIDAFYIERPDVSSDFTHHYPPRTNNITYKDFIWLSSFLRRKSGLVSVEMDSEEKRLLKRATKGLKNIFGVEIDLLKKARSKIEVHKSLIDFYELLLRKINPEVVVLVVSYGKETLIEACKGRGIPVVELQHGVIHEQHLGYHYPGDRDKKTFPDYLFTFGEYWNKAADFPIPEENIIPVGYPYLESKSQKYDSIPTKDQIIFISQGPVGKEFSKVAVELAEMDPAMDIVYKLHPGEYSRWKDEYPWLKEADLRVVDDDSIPLYRLFAESKVQVGVGSTAVFEGLRFDLITYLYDLPGIGIMKYLIERNYATIVDSAEELYQELQTTASSSYDTSDIFKPNAIENIINELESIRVGED